jgi:hypothetical protein
MRIVVCGDDDGINIRIFEHALRIHSVILPAKFGSKSFGGRFAHVNYGVKLNSRHGTNILKMPPADKSASYAGNSENVHAGHGSVPA